MSSRATREAVYYPSAGPFADSGAPGFVSLRQSASLEFHASVQLLAERARFLTGAEGVAVALSRTGSSSIAPPPEARLPKPAPSLMSPGIRLANA